MQHDYSGFPFQSRARAIAAAFPRNAQVITHRGQDLLMPVFDTSDAQIFLPNGDVPRVAVPAEAPVIRDLDTTWSLAKHAEARRPVSLGLVGDEVRRAFVQPLAPWTQHVLDMPIKFPGSREIRLPAALTSVLPAVRRIVDIEAQLNPRYTDYYAYLSVHQAQVGVGARMRENPYHVDGFQGPRWTRKHAVNHSYLLSDALPTVFYPMGFSLDHLDIACDDIYAEFARKIESRADAPTWRAQDWELILMDAYCVHRGDVAAEPVFRTWLRVSWETRVFDRLGNSENPLFHDRADYPWAMVARDTDLRVRPRPAPTSSQVALSA